MEKKRLEQIKGDGRVSHRRNLLPEARSRYVPVDTMRMTLRSESDDRAPLGIDRLIVRAPILDPRDDTSILKDVMRQIEESDEPITPNDLFLETVTEAGERARYLLNGQGLMSYDAAEDVVRVAYDTLTNDMFQVLHGENADEMIPVLNHLTDYIPVEQSAADIERP
jgi:hypothetical protein